MLDWSFQMCCCRCDFTVRQVQKAANSLTFIHIFSICDIESEMLLHIICLTVWHHDYPSARLASFPHFALTKSCCHGSYRDTMQSLQKQR